MLYLPILFACVMGSCDFMLAETEVSPADCYAVIEAAVREIEAAGGTVAGICIQVKVT